MPPGFPDRLSLLEVSSRGQESGMRVVGFNPGEKEGASRNIGDQREPESSSERKCHVKGHGNTGSKIVMWGNEAVAAMTA